MPRDALPGLVLLALTSILMGCVTGGRAVTMAHRDQYRTVRTFLRPDQPSPAAFEYTLIETGKGLGIMEWDNRTGKGFVSDFGWRDDKGSHYVWWVGGLGHDTGSAGEYVVPEDASQPVRVYLYPAGTYTVVEVNGITKPVPQVSPRSPGFILNQL